MNKEPPKQVSRITTNHNSGADFYADIKDPEKEWSEIGYAVYIIQRQLQLLSEAQMMLELHLAPVLSDAPPEQEPENQFTVSTPLTLQLSEISAYLQRAIQNTSSLISRAKTN